MLTQYGQQPSGADWARLGFAGANAIYRRRDRAQAAENEARQKEVYRVADAILQNPDADINSLSNDPMVRMAARAQVINMKMRQFDESKAGKQAILDDMKVNQAKLQRAYSAWLADPTPENAIKMHNLTPDGRNAELTKDGVKFTITDTGETFKVPVPTKEEINEAIMPFLEPQSYIKSYLAQRQARIDYNFKQASNPKPLYKGDSIVGYTYNAIDKATGKRHRFYVNENWERIPKPKGAKTLDEIQVGMKGKQLSIQEERLGLAQKKASSGSKPIQVGDTQMTTKEIDAEMKALKAVLSPVKGDKPLMLVSDVLQADDSELRTELDRLQDLAKKAKTPQSKRAAKRYLQLFYAITRTRGEGPEPTQDQDTRTILKSLISE